MQRHGFNGGQEEARQNVLEREDDEVRNMLDFFTVSGLAFSGMIVMTVFMLTNSVKVFSDDPSSLRALNGFSFGTFCLFFLGKILGRRSDIAMVMIMLGVGGCFISGALSLSHLFWPDQKLLSSIVAICVYLVVIGCSYQNGRVGLIFRLKAQGVRVG
ncbi:hypothetical protein CTI12_AA143680 [Artemisia annua]|uniref:Uncharacterized protein n=1 Tax=Artemisia annua TaxID=35608 RepID=A0A2U1PK68_ARTAN|nr:hypothetical protein CTI12_AA143680 [Artemisia annua]